MQWNWLSILALGFHSVVADEVASKSSDAVTQLAADTFRAFIRDNEHALVQFHAPWCGHCKKLAPEYEGAAAVIAADPEMKGVKFGKVDATEEKDLAEEFQVRGFPTVYYFNNGSRYEYDGGRTRDAIVNWMRKTIGPAVIFAHSKENATLSAQAGEGVAYIMTAPSSDHDLVKLFHNVASRFRTKGLFIAYINPKAKMISLEVQFGSESSYQRPGEVKTEEDIVQFVKAESTPTFGPFTPETYSLYVNKTDNWFWFTGGAEDYEEHKQEVAQVARTFRADFNFVWLDSSNEQFKKHAESSFGITSYPSAAVVFNNTKYRYGGLFKAVPLEKYIKDVQQGKVERFLLSEEIPENNTDPVKKVVGKNFEEIVLQKDKDVFLQIYAPWCRHCQKLKPIWEEFAIKMADFPNLVVAMMDGIANEPPVGNFEVKAFPTLYFVPAGATVPLMYSGDRTVEEFTKFSKAHMKLEETSNEIKDEL